MIYCLIFSDRFFFFSLQLGGFVEKYAGSGVSLHTQSSSNKENRRTEGLNRFLQKLQNNQGTEPGQASNQFSDKQHIL